jgi:putative hydrolase of the HAD superfamily
MSIQALTFDFWSTLYHYTQSPRVRRQQSIRAALATVGRSDIAGARVLEAMQCAWDVWDRVWKTEHTTPGAAEWLGFVLEQFAVVLPETTFAQTVYALERAAFTDTTRPVDGAPQALALLCEHYRLGIISDTGLGTGQVLRSLLRRDGLLSYFTYFVFSDEFGRSKPRPEVFHAALDGLNTAPHQAIHIGDLRHTDIWGAKRVGMGTVRFAGIRDDRDNDYPEADAVIQSYDELLAYFMHFDENTPTGNQHDATPP